MAERSLPSLISPSQRPVTHGVNWHYQSINSSISIFKGAKEGKLIAEAREVSHSPKLASFEVSIRNEAGDLLATFQGMVYRKSVRLESLLATRRMLTP